MSTQFTLMSWSPGSPGQRRPAAAAQAILAGPAAGKADRIKAAGQALST